LTIAQERPLATEPPQLPTSMPFIDGTNLDRTCLEKFGRNGISFAKLLPAVTRGTRLLHTFYVTAPYKREIDEQRYKVQTGMLNALRKLPNVTVDLQQHRMRDQRCKKCGHVTKVPKEEGTDVAVAAHLVEQAVLRAADEMILIANDTDYAPALKRARRHGRRCVLAYVLGSDEHEYSAKRSLAPLWNESSRIVRMDLPFLQACWLGQK